MHGAGRQAGISGDDSMKKMFCALLLIGMASAFSPSFAQSSTPVAKKETVKKTVKKPVRKHVKQAVAKPAEEQELVANDGDEPGETRIEGSTVTVFNCELGDRITTYINADDSKHNALRWKNRLHRLHQVGTTTGATRFENRKFGLIWIDIPSKAMLLDSKKGQQLANECRSPEQQKALAAKG
jgi:hypothetical protein